MKKIIVNILKNYILPIVCALIAGGYFIQNHKLSSQNTNLINQNQDLTFQKNKLVEQKNTINNEAKIIIQYIGTNNINLPEPIKNNFDKIVTVSGDTAN